MGSFPVYFHPAMYALWNSAYFHMWNGGRFSVHNLPYILLVLPHLLLSTIQCSSPTYYIYTDILGNDEIYNGGFTKGSSTTDNMLVLNSLVQTQKAPNKPLFVAFIDFRKAFDSVNHTLSFYKLMKSGYTSKINTLLKWCRPCQPAWIT
jgi:hypothetical protein